MKTQRILPPSFILRRAVALLLYAATGLALAGCDFAAARPVMRVTATPSPAHVSPALTPSPPTASPAPVTPAPTEAAPTATRPTPTPTARYDPAYNPLTGLELDDPALLQRRPLAAKISNAPDVVRPQAGISQADMVFEHYTEGSLTRFTAIYWSQTPPRVGSIRSARLLDVEIPAMYGTLLVYSGASEPIRQRIASLPFAPRAFEGVTVGPPLYFRDPEIEVPHNLFAIPAEVWARAEEQGVNTPPVLNDLVFSVAAPASDGTARTITIPYGPDTVRWDYDPATGRYARFVDGAPHTDANNGAQVMADNVVLVYAHHQPDLAIVESEWQGNLSFSIEIQIWTLGPATIFRDGERIDGYWTRWEEDHPLTFWRDEGATEAIPLKPGTTWFQVVPLDFTAVSME